MAFEDMNDKEFADIINSMMQEVFGSRSNSDFVPNQVQIDKMLDLLSFLRKEVPDLEITDIDAEPRMETGGFIVKAPLFDFTGEVLETFTMLLRYCSSVGIEGDGKDNAIISVTIPNMYVSRFGDE